MACLQIDLFLGSSQQIKEQSSQVALLQSLSDILIAGTVAAASTAVRKEHHAPGLSRPPQNPVERDVALQGHVGQDQGGEDLGDGADLIDGPLVGRAVMTLRSAVGVGTEPSGNP